MPTQQFFSYTFFVYHGENKFIFNEMMTRSSVLDQHA